MRDPIKDLQNFDHRGTPVNHLTASEVRRRGDRMRRRNNVLAGVGGVAAVVLIATPFAVFAAHDTSSTPDPAPAPTSPTHGVETTWLQQIPSTFDLTENLADPTTELSQSETPTIEDITMCGVSSWSAAAGLPAGPMVDALGTSNSGGESFNARTLVLYTDPDTAQSALEAIRAGVVACPEDPNGSPVPQVHSLIDMDLGTDDSFVFTEQARVEGALSDLFVTQVARTGNALYLAMTYGSVGGQDAVNTAVEMLADSSAPVLSNLCVFSAEPCTDPAPTGDPSESSGSGIPNDGAIPADFPLDVGWPDPGGDAGITGPDRNQEPIRLSACDSEVPDPTFADRMLATYSAPEDYRTRQLTTYVDADAAVAAVADLVDAYKACPQDTVDEAGFVTDHEVQQLDVGGESWAILARDTLDGMESPFGSTTIIVRVGSAVLLLDHGGHAGYPSDDGAADIESTLAEAAVPIAQMCVFTQAGC